MTQEQANASLELPVERIALVEPLEFAGVVFIEGACVGWGEDVRLGYVETRSQAAAAREQLQEFLRAAGGRTSAAALAAELERIRASLPQPEEEAL